MSTLLTASQAAARLGVDASTVRRYAAAGKLEHTRTVGGHLRVAASAVEQLTARTLAPTPSGRP